MPADLAKALILLRQATDAIAETPNLTRPQNGYNLAYDAWHDFGEAVLAAYGYRCNARPVGEAEVELEARTAVALFAAAVVRGVPEN